LGRRRLALMNTHEKRVINVSIALVGLLGSVISVLTAPPHLRLIFGVAFALLAIVVVLIILWRRVSKLRRSQKALLSDDALIAVTSRFVLRPADKSDVDWVAAQEAQVYSDDDAIPADILREWFAANPYAFNIICDLQASRVGHFNIIPIKPNTLQLLLDGKIRERDVRGDSIYSAAERDAVSCLWVESIAIDVSNPYLRARALLNVFERAHDTIERLANPVNLTHFYALSATSAGDNLIKRFGFQVASAQSKRTDGHDLYCASYEVIKRKTEDLLVARGIK
jgi:hypothetical protein